MEHLGHVFFCFEIFFSLVLPTAFGFQKTIPEVKKRPEVLIQLKRFSWATFVLRERREKSGNVSPIIFCGPNKILF